MIGPVDDKFAQTTAQLVSEGSFVSVLPGWLTLLAENAHAKSKETPFVPERRLLMERSRN